MSTLLGKHMGESLFYYIELSMTLMITFTLLLNLESKIEGLQDVYSLNL